MLVRVLILLIISFFALSCSSRPEAGASTPPANTTTTSSPQADTDVTACKAIPREEIRAVQGEEVSEAKGNNSTSGGLAVSHCVYLLPTYSKSLSLDITRADQSAEKGLIKKFWETRFGGLSKEEEPEAREREAREREERREASKKERGRGEEEEEETKPRYVSGVGDEAFWVGSGVKGTLYVLKSDAVLILSIGGAEDEATRIKKTTTLAQLALKRL